MKSGGEAVLYGIVPDQLSALKEIASRALMECDVVLITAGSSASTRDMTAEVIGSLGAARRAGAWHQYAPRQADDFGRVQWQGCDWIARQSRQRAGEWIFICRAGD